MKKYLPFVLVAAAVAYYYVSFGSAAKKLKFYFQSIKFGPSRGFSIPPIYAVFRIVNPSNTTISVDSIAGDITINGSALASIQNLEKFTVSARSERLFEIKIQAPITNVLSTAYQLFTTKGKKYSIAFDGTVNAAGAAIAINQTIVQVNASK
jgi:LEA14-like dessication related protein